LYKIVINFLTKKTLLNFKHMILNLFYLFICYFSIKLFLKL